MSHRKHLTLPEREDIMVMHRGGMKQVDIAEAIGRDKSTVSRELSRNSSSVGGGTCYRASTAQARYEKRREAARSGSPTR